MQLLTLLLRLPSKDVEPEKKNKSMTPALELKFCWSGSSSFLFFNLVWELSSINLKINHDKTKALLVGAPLLLFDSEPLLPPQPGWLCYYDTLNV